MVAARATRQSASEEAATVDPQVVITALFCFEVVLVAIGGGYLVRYETRREHVALANELAGGRSR